MKFLRLGIALAAFTTIAIAQQLPKADFKLALADHKGHLLWHAEGFKIVQSSAKLGGREIGIRGNDSSGKLGFLGFLFLAPEGVPQNSMKCREQVLDYDKKGNPTLKIVRTSELTRSDGLSVALAVYSEKSRDGSTEYNARGFIATADICGDLDFYSKQPISDEDKDLAAIFASYQLDPEYNPTFADVFQYAQVLYQTGIYKAAAPIFEKALGMVPPDGSPFPSNKIATRIATDQAGIAYGISGDSQKARAIFESAIDKDPKYPMYYYNLACANAQENDLPETRRHLQEAFARKAYVNSGEPLPDPTKDDSFLPYKGNKEFWNFVKSLRNGDTTPDPPSKQ